MANEAYEMILFDCRELLERKHYMNCVLSTAQAYEMFFSLYLRVELLYRPYAGTPGHRLQDLNQLAEDLTDKINDSHSPR